MKEVNVTFKSDGKIQSIDADSIFLEEENLSVKITASFPSDLTISGVRAYIRTNSGVQDCITPVLSNGKYTLTLTGDKLEKGVLKIGYEVTSGSASIRFAPVVLNVDGFISDDYIISKKLYTVSVSVVDTQTVDSTQNASVENVGSSKEVKLKFKIPKGEKGDKGDMPAVTDSLDSDSTTAALSANQGKVLDGKKVDKVSGKGLSSNDYTTAEKTKVANLPDDTNTELNGKINKSDVFSVGNHTGNVLLDVNNRSIGGSGVAIGNNTYVTNGVAIGASTTTTSGVAIGNNSASNGVAIGGAAQCINSNNQTIDAIQLGMGTNCATRTLQVYNYQLMDANGYVPNERLRKISTGAVTSLLLKDRLEKQMLSSDTASLTLTIPAIPNSYECAFSFKSGATATTLVYSATPITWRGTDCDADGDFTPRANAGYEVSIKCLGMDADNNPVVVARVGGF